MCCHNARISPRSENATQAQISEWTGMQSGQVQLPRYVQVVSSAGNGAGACCCGGGELERSTAIGDGRVSRNAYPEETGWCGASTWDVLEAFSAHPCWLLTVTPEHDTSIADKPDGATCPLSQPRDCTSDGSAMDAGSTRDVTAGGRAATNPLCVAESTTTKCGSTSASSCLSIASATCSTSSTCERPSSASLRRRLRLRMRSVSMSRAMGLGSMRFCSRSELRRSNCSGDGLDVDGPGTLAWASYAGTGDGGCRYECTVVLAGAATVGECVDSRPCWHLTGGAGGGCVPRRDCQHTPGHRHCRHWRPCTRSIKTRPAATCHARLLMGRALLSDASPGFMMAGFGAMCWCDCSAPGCGNGHACLCCRLQI